MAGSTIQELLNVIDKIKKNFKDSAEMLVDNPEVEAERYAETLTEYFKDPMNFVGGGAGILKGAKAKGWNAEAAKQYKEELAKLGKNVTINDRETLWARTGTSQNPVDKKLRQEIPDQPAVIRESLFKDPKIKTVKMKDILDHPELYANYPHLKDMEVDLKAGEKYGGYFPATADKPARIMLGEKNAKNVLLHEIQHDVQYIEDGFSKGSNLEKGQKYIDDLMSKYITGSQLIATKGKDLTPAAKEMLVTRMDAVGQELQALDNKPLIAYAKKGGEAESRIVEKRADEAPEFLKNTDPYSQDWYDFPIDELIK